MAKNPVWNLSALFIWKELYSPSLLKCNIAEYTPLISQSFFLATLWICYSTTFGPLLSDGMLATSWTVIPCCVNNCFSHTTFKIFTVFQWVVYGVSLCGSLSIYLICSLLISGICRFTGFCQVWRLSNHYVSYFSTFLLSLSFWGSPHLSTGADDHTTSFVLFDLQVFFLCILLIKTFLLLCVHCHWFFFLCISKNCYWATPVHLFFFFNLSAIILTASTISI